MKGIEKDQNRFATTRWRKFIGTRCYANVKHHHRLVSSVMQVMKTRLGNTRPATKAPLCHIGKVYTYSVIYTQNNTNPYINKEKVKLYLHLSTVSDVLEYCLRITAFCLFLKTSISLRLRLNPENTNIILLHEKFLKFDWLRAVIFQLNLKYLHVNITKQLMVVV